MKIQVTQKHIDEGFRGSCSSDPICLAMKDAGLKRPWVSPDHIAWDLDNRHYSVKTPELVWGFMVDYDTGRYVRPFEFELEGV